ncbi:MAG: asparagine synthase (glutamine-hydrolyzing) [bacterium]
MCGICGIYNSKDSKSKAEQITKEMTRTLIHRGPDEDGFLSQNQVQFGMRRLKVIDLVTGSQPIFNEDKSIAVICNGEIYNYQDLRKELELKGHVFSTKSDIEVIVHLYEDEGEGFVNKLNGDFAIALWDEKQKKLMVIRDRLGAKPLYYSFCKGVLYFASEIKALFSVPGMSKEIDFRALDIYFSLSYVPAPKSIFKHIKKISPGQMLVAKDEKFNLKTYWSLNEHNYQPKIKDENEAVEMLDKLLSDAVRIRLRSDVPLGVLLSSGLDSSTITSYASKWCTSPLKTYSIIFKESSFNEGSDAKLTADYLNTEHHEIELHQDLEHFFNSFTTHFDEPFGDYSCIPTFFVSRAVKKDVTVALSGDGGDELLGGYPTYYAYYFYKYYTVLPKLIKNRLMPFISQIIPATFDRLTLDYRMKQFVAGAQAAYPQAHFLWRGYFTERDKNELYSDDLNAQLEKRSGLDVYSRYLPKFNKDEEPISQLMRIDLMSQLSSGYNAKVDMMSMANSLEIRSPFYDHRIIKFSQNLPDSLKVHNLNTKYILKKLMKNKLPKRIFRVPKRGFTVPLAQWLTTRLKNTCLDLLSASNVNSTKLFNHKYIEKLISDHFSRKKDNNRKIWTLMSFMQWYKNYGA